MECYLLSEPMIRGYRKRMLSLWLQKGMYRGRKDKLPALRNVPKKKLLGENFE